MPFFRKGLFALLLISWSTGSALAIAGRTEPPVREDDLLRQLFGKARLNEFFDTSFRQKQYRVKPRNDDVLNLAFGDSFAEHRGPQELTQYLFDNFVNESNNNAFSMQDAHGERLPRPDGDTSVPEALAKGNSFVFRFEHLAKGGSMPVVDSLEALLLTTVTPHIYASGKTAQALKPHTDMYDVVIVHMAGRKVWYTCIPRSNSSEQLSEAARAEMAEIQKEQVDGEW